MSVQRRIWALLLTCTIVASRSVAVAIPPTEDAIPDTLRLNQLQCIGTHNSYHVESPHSTLAKFAPDLAQWEYSHRPLNEQLEQLGLRVIELDCYADPDGGRFARNDTAAGKSRPADVALWEPGFKVFHFPDLDQRSTCPTLRGCLSTIRAFSVANPRHAPILVSLELNHQALPPIPGVGFASAVPIDSALLDALDAEVLEALGPDGLIRPDDVRGPAVTLAAAVRQGGWPTLGTARGKVLIVLNVPDELIGMYLEGHPSLEGRACFVDAPVDSPAAAIFIMNSPVSQLERIQGLVRDGFLVRTRADAGLKEARSGDTQRREAALASGAQFVSTDFPEVRPEISADYRVRFEGEAAVRVNPITAQTGGVERTDQSPAATTAGATVAPPRSR